MKKHFLVPDQKYAKRQRKRFIENSLNTQTLVHRSIYLKLALKNQVFSYNRDELLRHDDLFDRIWKIWKWTSFLLIFRLFRTFFWVDLFKFNTNHWNCTKQNWSLPSNCKFLQVNTHNDFFWCFFSTSVLFNGSSVLWKY